MNITDAKRQDTADAKEIAHSIRKGDLIIRDMGYFGQQYSTISLKLAPTFLAGPGLKLSFMIPGMES